MELQAAIGALEAIKKLFVVEHGKKAIDAVQEKDFKTAEKLLTELLEVMSRRSTDI